MEGGRKRRTGSPQDMRERKGRETDRQRDRQTETETDRDRDTDRDRERQTETETETDREMGAVGVFDLLGMYYKRSQFCTVLGLFAVPSGNS